MKQKIITISPFLFLFLIFLFRYDSFQNIILNIDEVEWIYTLNRCYLNPIPFVGFDAHTSGPFAIYLLLPLKLFVSSVELNHLRIYNFFVFIIPSLFFVFYSFKGRLAIFSLSIFSSFFLIFNKDFFAYNSEYPIILFVTIIVYLLLGKSYNLSKLTFILLLVVILPFIKFQAILLSFFFFFMLINNINFYNRKLLKKMLFITFIIVLIIMVLIQVFIGVDLFYYSYIVRNVEYANSFSSKNWLVSISENIYLHLTLFYPFYILLIAMLSFLIKKYFTFILNLFMKLQILKKTDFLLIGGLFVFSFISVLIPKNNFTHYFILMFPSLNFLLVYLLSKLSFDKIAVFIILLLINVNYLQINADKVYSKLITGNSKGRLYYEKYQLSPKVEKEIDTLIYNKIKPGDAVIILGWFNALPTYYKYKDKFIYPYRSGHSVFLYNSSFFQDKKVFQLEFANFKKDISNQKKVYLLDLEGNIKKINSNQFKKYIKNKFDIVRKTNNFLLFESK